LVMKWICRVFNALHGPRLCEIIWHLLTRVRALSEAELNAASSVLGASAIQYSAVRVADGRFLWLIFKFNKRRAFATFHTINIPDSSDLSSSHLAIVVHELTHVYQFELIGSIYIWQALRAQRSGGYQYGGWPQLEKDRSKGKHFSDYNREQQGQITQDYYSMVVANGLSAEDPIYKAYELFINELRNGEL
jgi:hypothetical protein